jgi:hypothetical protein
MSFYLRDWFTGRNGCNEKISFVQKIQHCFKTSKAVKAAQSSIAHSDTEIWKKGGRLNFVILNASIDLSGVCCSLFPCSLFPQASTETFASEIDHRRMLGDFKKLSKVSKFLISACLVQSLVFFFLQEYQMNFHRVCTTESSDTG